MENVSIRKYDYIDALRGFAILGVVFVHASLVVSPESPLLSIVMEQGARGVQLFYVASALTLFLSMEARKHKESHVVKNFFIRRFFRIAPLFYLALIVYTLVDGFSSRYWAPDGIEWWYIPLTAFFINGWHPEIINSIIPGGWSIAVEMTFYLLMPLLFKVLTDIKTTAFFLFGSLVIAKLLSSLAMSLLFPHYPHYLVLGFIDLWFFSHLPVFILGILVYHVVRKYPNTDKKMGLFLLLVSLFLFAAFLTSNTFSDLLPRHFLYGVAFLTFSLALHFWPNPLLVNKITTLIGRLSFSIYLVHFLFVSHIMNMIYRNGFSGLKLKGDIGFVFTFLQILLLSIGVSYITYKLVEIPGINLGRKIIESTKKNLNSPEEHQPLSESTN